METLPTSPTDTGNQLLPLLFEAYNSIIRIKDAAREKTNLLLVDWADGLLQSCREQIVLLDSSHQMGGTQPESSDGRADSGDKSSSALSGLSGLEALVAACDLEVNVAAPAPMPTTQPSCKRDKYRCDPDILSKPTQSRRQDKPSGKNHKSKVKVWIRPNKVVYLPTTFIEDNFDHSLMPVINCSLVVEADGVEQPGRHEVTIKSVPRQGLSTMYCMSSVLKFQQSFINWAVVGWSKLDLKTIKIHLQAPLDEDGLPVVPSEGKHAKRKILSDSANDERELGSSVVNEDSKPRERTPRSLHRAHKQSAPVVMSQTLDLSPANSDGEMPTFAAFPHHPPYPPTILPPYPGMYNPLPPYCLPNSMAFTTAPATMSSAPSLGGSLAWQMLLGGPGPCIPARDQPSGHGRSFIFNEILRGNSRSHEEGKSLMLLTYMI